MNKIKMIIGLIGIMLTGLLYSDNHIIVYLRHAPDEAIQAATAEAKSESLEEKVMNLDTQSPGETSKRLVKNEFRTLFTPQLSGFMGAYAGFMDVSNNDGLMEFPLRHTAEKVYLLITPEITLIKVSEGTISHREMSINKEVQSELYLLERKQDEKKNGYWEISKQSLPEDKKINPLTVVLFAKPKNVFIREGSFFTVESPHLVLPDIYVLSTMDQEKILMQALDIKRYFEPITHEEKKTSDTTTQKLITTI